MSLCKCFSNFKLYNSLNTNFRRSYSILVSTKKALRNVNTLSSKNEVVFSSRRHIRGGSRFYEIPSNKSDGNEDDSEIQRRPQVEIRKSKIRDLLENSVTDAQRMVTEEKPDRWASKTYPKIYTDPPKRVPVCDPKEVSVFLFPGQGSQYVGMAKNLLKYPNVEKMFKVASEILGFDLLNMCLYGPITELNKTIHCQPAVVVSSLAALEKLKEDSPHIVDSCIATAGFSVGEITALIFSGVLSFEDGMKLIRVRAEAMQAASEMESGGMLTVFYGADARIGFACSTAIEWCNRQGIESPVCVVANYLYAGCKVIAGHSEAIKFIMMNAQDFGIRRYKELPVSGAFHTSLMEPAREAVKIALKSMTLNEPLVTVYANLNGKQYSDAEAIRHRLPKQISSPVRWEQLLHCIYKRAPDVDYPKTFECGPGKSLYAILAKVNGKAFNCAVSTDACLLFLCK